MPERDQIKEAFSKVKSDIILLKQEMNKILLELQEIKRTYSKYDTTSSQTDRQTDNQTDSPRIQTDNQTDQTDRQTDRIEMPLEGPEMQNNDISIGNNGVQTDRQTIRQTDRQTQKSPENSNLSDSGFIHSEKFAQSQKIQKAEDRLVQLQKVSEFINSLDDIKKDLRSKFKKLTDQEMLVFSSVYQLEDQGFSVDYSLLSSKTKLSQSAIRDYVQKILLKGIPLDKLKQDNKRIILSISPNLKKITNLEGILSLREL